MRPSTQALFLLAVAGIALGAAILDSLLSTPADNAALQAQVADWRLTDLVLFTEARYTRHPSQADRFAAFQDHPGALEHFPSGTLMRPPRHWLRGDAP